MHSSRRTLSRVSQTVSVVMSVQLSFGRDRYWQPGGTLHRKVIGTAVRQVVPDAYLAEILEVDTKNVSASTRSKWLLLMLHYAV